MGRWVYRNAIIPDQLGTCSAVPDRESRQGFGESGLKRHGSTAALVIGDDRTDAEAFRRVTAERRAGRLAASLLLGVYGARETPPELLAAADVILPEPAASAIVLRALARTLEAEERPHRER